MTADANNPNDVGEFLAGDGNDRLYGNAEAVGEQDAASFGLLFSNAHLGDGLNEQLVALQGCLTDRQALVKMFENFSTELKQQLDCADCVDPQRFTPFKANVQTSKLPESK